MAQSPGSRSCPPPVRPRDRERDKAFPHRRKRGLTSVSVVALLALFVFPALALLHLDRTISLRFTCGYAVLISAATYLLYRQDKRKAQTGAWRTPETTLHLVELLGGWPGAFLAQRIVRHKISKRSYQMTFWTIVALYQFASFDFAQDWRYSRDAYRAVRNFDANRRSPAIPIPE